MDLNDIYRKIKKISALTANPRPKILTALLAQELLLRRENLVPYLIELDRLRLIRFESKSDQYVNLTLLGCCVKR